MTISFQVRIRILSRKVGYLLSLNELGEKLQATLIVGKFVIGLWFSENVFHWSRFKARSHDIPFLELLILFWLTLVDEFISHNTKRILHVNKNFMGNQS